MHRHSYSFHFRFWVRSHILHIFWYNRQKSIFHETHKSKYVRNFSSITVQNLNEKSQKSAIILKMSNLMLGNTGRYFVSLQDGSFTGAALPSKCSKYTAKFMAKLLVFSRDCTNLWLKNPDFEWSPNCRFFQFEKMLKLRILGSQKSTKKCNFLKTAKFTSIVVIGNSRCFSRILDMSRKKKRKFIVKIKDFGNLKTRVSTIHFTQISKFHDFYRVYIFYCSKQEFEETNANQLFTFDVNFVFLSKFHKLALFPLIFVFQNMHLFTSWRTKNDNFEVLLKILTF